MDSKIVTFSLSELISNNTRGRELIQFTFAFLLFTFFILLTINIPLAPFKGGTLRVPLQRGNFKNAPSKGEFFISTSSTFQLSSAMALAKADFNFYLFPLLFFENQGKLLSFVFI